jgi:hypothetical protein
MRGLFWSSLLVAFIGISPAFAQGTEEERAHCSRDAHRLCDALIPDAIAVENCLRQHLNQLSPACRAELSGVRKKRRHRRE